MRYQQRSRIQELEAEAQRLCSELGQLEDRLVHLLLTFPPRWRPMLELWVKYKMRRLKLRLHIVQSAREILETLQREPKAIQLFADATIMQSIKNGTIFGKFQIVSRIFFSEQGKEVIDWAVGSCRHELVEHLKSYCDNKMLSSKLYRKVISLYCACWTTLLCQAVVSILDKVRKLKRPR